MDNFGALTFFLGPNLSVIRSHFDCVDAAPRFMLPSAISISFASCPKEVGWPSSTYVVASFAAYTAATTSVALFCSATFCAASRIALNSVASFSLYLFSIN